MLESAARARCLSVLDLTDAYHQIRVKPSSEKYNTINTPFGCYKIRVMLQGDANAPATMMRNMTKIFGDIIDTYVWVYLDDVIVFSDNKTDHISHLREIFRRLQKNSFYLKLEKCQFMLKRIKLLGHYIEEGRIIPAKEQIQKIQDWRSPTTKKQLQSFIGLVNYIAPHLPHAATLLSQITELTGSTNEWEWLPMHEQAFKNLKRICDESKALKPLDYEQIKKGRVNVFLVTDASKVGTGAFICHGHKYEDAKRNIAALHSRKFSASQGNYHTTDQECLAIVDALKAFETRLLGIPFTIVTDHQALQYMISNEIKSSRQMRWMDYIQRFNFEIRYEPGGTNLLADALSRIYYDIRTDEIQPEEQVIDMEKDQKWIPPKQHLNKEEFPTDVPDHHLETQRITNLLQRSSIREQTTSIPHVMAMSIPRRPECDIGLHWSFCKLRRGKGPGCPFHHSTTGFATYSEYMDMEVYKRNLEEWDAKYGPSSASNTTEFTNPELVHNEVSGIQKRTRRSRRQMAKRHQKPPSESNETDEDGYPLRIKWITSNESEENSPMERSYFRDTTFRKGRTVNKEPLSHVVTRSKAMIANEKDTGEGSRELVIQQPVPTRTIQEDITKMEEEVEKEKEQEVELEEPGRVMDEEWMRNYTKDLILPRGGLPKDLLTGVIRVVDGKHYHLDQYLEKAFEGELTPLETNIYHAGNTDPSLLPRPFQTIDYSTSFGKAFFNALAKDPTWTKCRGTGGQPFNTHPLGYILFQRPGKGIRVYVPEGPFTPDDTGIESTVRTTIIAEAHHELAHLGTQKTYLHIAPHCYWPKMFKDVERYVQTCPECQVNKQPTTKPAGVAHVLPIPERPWQSVAIDFIGPITASQGYTNIMVIMDRFSGFLLCFPLKNKFSAVDVADTFLFTFYGRYGLPESIVSDRDTGFTGKFWESLMETLGIKTLMSTAFHQETNGQVERTNKTIIQMLRIFGNSSGNDWASNLWRVEHAHNAAQLTWTNRSPYEIVYGKPPIEIPENLPESSLPAVERYLDNLIVNHKVAHDALILARYRTADTVNKRRNPAISFKEGDYVLYQRRTMDKNKSRKLQSIWVGPYQVIAVSGETGNCKLSLPSKLKIHPWFATDKLKLYQPWDGHYPSPLIEDKEKEYEEEYEVDQVLDYDHEKDRYLVSWKGNGPEDNQWEPATHLRNAPDKTADYWQHRSQNSSVTRAFRKANEENSRMKRTSVHSRLIQHTPADFFCPSDDTDGEGMEDEEASFHLGGEV
jgi:transposase InsO family protein